MKKIHIRDVFCMTDEQFSEIRRFVGDCSDQAENIVALGDLLLLKDMGAPAVVGFLFGLIVKENQEKHDTEHIMHNLLKIIEGR